MTQKVSSLVFLKYYVCLVNIMMLFSCSNDNKIAIYDVSDLGEDRYKILSQWNVLGPVRLEDTLKDKKYIDIDHLRQISYNEREFVSNPFLMPAKASFKLFFSKELENTYKKFNSEIIDFSEIKPNEKLKNVFGSAIYFSCKIVSPKEDTIHFLTKSSDALKIWLNSSLVNESNNQKRSLNLFYDDFTSLHLNKGVNILTVKKINYSGEIYFKGIFCRNKYRDLLFHERNVNLLLQKSIEKDKLLLCENFSNVLDSTLLYSIKDVNGKEVFSHKIPVCSDPLIPIGSLAANHAYLVSYCKNGFKFSQAFYKGNADSAYGFYAKQKIRFTNNIEQISQIDTYLYRLRFLLNHSSRKDDWWWSHKVSHLLYELENYFNNLDKKQSELTNSTGVQLRAYRSKIDNSIQHYVFISPDNYDVSKALPLVVLVKPISENHHHFLSSSQLSRAWSINRAKYLANKYRYNILLPSGRFYLNEEFVPISESEILNAMQDVEKNYNIDIDRIYLQGNCSAGKRALTFAGHYPDKFAAVGLYAPVYKTMNSNKWLTNNGPESLLGNLSNLPLFIHYDKQDTHSPFVLFEKLLDDCNKKGMDLKVSSSALSGMFYNTFLVGEETFSFFKGKRRKTKNVKINYKSYNSKYNKIYWLSFEKDQLKDKSEIKADFTVNSQTISITGKNISKISIDLKTLSINPKLPLIVNYNDKQLYHKVYDKPRLDLRIKMEAELKNKFDIKDKVIADLFGDPFIIIANSNKKENKLLSSLKNEYENFYFAKCPIYYSDNISNIDLKSKNILFIGHEFNNNLIIKNALDAIPLDVQNDFVKIGGKSIRGNNITFMNIFKSPFNPDKIMAIYSSNNNQFDHMISSPWIYGFESLIVED